MVYFDILWYIVVYKGTAYLDDGLWVWQYQSEHSGGSSKQHRKMSTLELLYADVRQHRAHASQDQLESIVRKVCVQRDLQQSQYISLIIPGYEFENSVKWFKLTALSKAETACSKMVTSSKCCIYKCMFDTSLGDYRNYHVVLYTIY